MKKRLLILTVLVATATLSFAQDIEKKLSISTQMFLSEQRGELELNVSPQRKAREKQLNLHPVASDAMRKYDRFIAAPDTIDGQIYMSCFIILDDVNNTGDLEALGVQVQETFNKGRITALIPVDKIEDVAALNNVQKIKAATMMRPTTYKARQQTNVDDLLTQSADAVSMGITKKYDGTGVILGVIDTGIDFNHIAFKDKNGNSRIKQAYVYNGSSATTYTGSQITSSLTDDKSEDHGTHTSTTAGGSSVVVNGTTVTVTDDHASATYGGMAPGADLYIAGIKNLSDTYLTNAVNNMVTYANNQNKPLVVSNSWGSQLGPHDGTGDVADVYNGLFGDSHPNRIALFAASNDGGKSKDNEGGGYHVSGTASSGSPLQTILRSASYTNTDAGYFYQGLIASAWARSTSVSKLGVKIHVLDANTGANKTTVTVTSAGTVSGLSTYYSGTLYVYYDQVESDKTQLVLYSSNGITSRSTSTTTKNGEDYYTSNYTLAIEVYPTSGSSVVDIWGCNYCYFTNHLSTSGYNWKAGSDDMSVSDEAMISNVISVGAYVSSKTWKAYNGTTYTASEYTEGDIAGFSSYATAAESPNGVQYPWITAPGARLIAGVNHNHTTSVDSYSYYGSTDLVVNSTTNPYAAMEGTSMATPTAAGIVALWLQASMEQGAAHTNLTVNDVKNIMRETAIHDAYTTTGPNASHFGQGKIDALAGVQYILGTNGSPTIVTDPTSVDFEQSFVGHTYTKTVSVQGMNLEGNVTATLTGATGVYSIDKTNITKAQAEAGTDITITYAPQAVGTNTATLTLTSTGADAVAIDITGTAVVPELIVDQESLTFATPAGTSTTGQFGVLGENLVGAVTLTLSGDTDAFSLSQTSITKTQAQNGRNITVTFNPSEAGTYTATVTVSTEDVADQTVTLTGTAAAGWVDVTINKYGVGTLYSAIPLEIPYDTYDDLLGVFYGRSCTETELRIKRIWTNIPAETGVIVMANSGTYRFPIATTAVTPISDNILEGTLEPMSVSNVDGTVMLLDKGANGYIGFYPTSETTVPANEAYIVYRGAGEAKGVAINYSGMPTGILNLVQDDTEQEIYDLSGRKVQKPSRGLYIVNGKKVFIK